MYMYTTNPPPSPPSPLNTFAPFSYPMFPFLIEAPQLNTAIQPQVIKINVIMAKALLTSFVGAISYTHKHTYTHIHNTHNELRRRRIWYSTCIKISTTRQISATLHKLLPVHPTGHMLHVRLHIFDVGETNASSYQQLTVCGATFQWDVLKGDILVHVHVQCVTLNPFRAKQQSHTEGSYQDEQLYTTIT